MIPRTPRLVAKKIETSISTANVKLVPKNQNPSSIPRNQTDGFEIINHNPNWKIKECALTDPRHSKKSPWGGAHDTNQPTEMKMMIGLKKIQRETKEFGGKTAKTLKGKRPVLSLQSPFSVFFCLSLFIIKISKSLGVKFWNAKAFTVFPPFPCQNAHSSVVSFSPFPYRWFQTN